MSKSKNRAGCPWGGSKVRGVMNELKLVRLLKEVKNGKVRNRDYLERREEALKLDLMNLLRT